MESSPTREQCVATKVKSCGGTHSEHRTEPVYFEAREE
jgi:hypothetical protein